MGKKLLLLFLCLFIITSCGDKNEDEDIETTETQIEVTTPEIQDEEADEVLDSREEIEKKLQLIEEAKKTLEEKLLESEPTSFLKNLLIPQTNAADESLTELESMTSEELLALIGDTLEEVQELSTQVEDPEEAEEVLLEIQDISEEISEEIQTTAEIAGDEGIISQITQFTQVTQKVNGKLKNSIDAVGKKIEKKFIAEGLSDEEIQAWKEKREAIHQKKTEAREAFKAENKAIREQLKSGAISKEQAKEIKQVKREEFKAIKEARKTEQKELRNKQNLIKKQRKEGSVGEKKEPIQEKVKQNKAIINKVRQQKIEQKAVKIETKQAEVKVLKEQKKIQVEQKKKELKKEKIEIKKEIEKEENIYSDEVL